MDTALINQFIYGAVMMASVVASLFFLKFWQKTKDRFFAIFSSAFMLFAIERWISVIMATQDETRTWIFMIRLLAFVLIIGAVVDKNRN